MKLSLGGYFLILSLMIKPISSLAGEKIAVAVVKSADLDIYSAALDGFNEIMKDNKINISFVNYNIKENEDDGVNILKEIKTKKPALVLTFGSATTKLVSDTIKDIPMVFSVVLNPVEAKIVQTMGPSGTNLTGVSLDIPLKQQLELLKKILPQAVKVGVFYDPKNSRDIIEEATKLQTELNIQIIAVKINVATEVPRAIKEIGDKIDVFWLIPDVSVYTKDSLPFILQSCLDNKIPVMGFAEYLVRAGALFSYMYDYRDMGRQTGEIAARILAGEAAGGIPVAVPRRVNYILNLKVAAALEVKIPSKALKEATKILE